MIFKRHFAKIPKPSLVIYWLVGLLLLLSGNLAAGSNNYQLNEISQLEHHQINNKHWQQIIANPSNSQQFFIINSTGQLYTLADTITPTAVLDLTSGRLENSKQQDTSIIKLTAIALHPNFSLRDQVGYGTFYTAHLEPINNQTKTKRLQERSTDLDLKFDSVITEWQFNAVNHQKVDISTKREVLRIAVPNKSFTIEQLAFNPMVKSWNDNFGLLYISLSGDKKWQKPLYSGVILRINPAKFGLRSFTVPSNNPFLKDSQVKDEIYVLGGQSIQQFIWPDKNSEQILLVHQYNQKELLSLTTGRDDWRVQAPKKVIYQSDEAVGGLVMYRGRSLPYLRNKLLLLRYKEQSWQVESLVFKHSSLANKKPNTPQLEWQFTPQQLPANSQPSLATNLSDEVLILDNSENLLYRLSQESADAMDKKEQITEEPATDNGFFVLFIFAMVAGAFYYLVKRNTFSAKTIVRQQYARFELSESKQQIGLYHRHESSAETIIDLVDIVSSEVQLNERSISLINRDEGHGFSNDKEQDLRAIFTKEHIGKMINGKTRQISLHLVDKKKHSYIICLYMRKGSNRITKKGYFKVIDELIDWCWLIGKKINSEQTGERKATVKETGATEQMVEKEEENTPLHNQAAAIRPVTHKASVKPKVRVVNTASTEVTNKAVSESKASQNSNANGNKTTNSTIDTELVNALEKLVSLKQEGFLTAEEFAQAKAKLLENLFDKR